ncbi:MAG: septum formation inhibitor Maf [Syntrophomonadaceae bacterium]|nr:septum formation inhibitor Maf [Syntrophomonadaceae bacterium]
MKSIILASSSPRRKDLLKMLNLRFICKPAEINEHFLPGEEPVKAVKRVARQKAEAVARPLAGGADSLVIAADTIVECDGIVLGKPVDKEDAFSKLAVLSGRCHRVITAVCVEDVNSREYELEAEVTNVYFHDISAEEIWNYIATGEPMDKAGAYGIQGLGSVFVKRIEGCYFNVVGLPLSKLHIMLKRKGVNVLGGYSAD